MPPRSLSQPSDVPRSQSVGRAILLMDLLARQPAVSVATLARESGLPRATVTRLLATLADHGVAMRAADGRWSLGPALVRMARAVAPRVQVIERARPLLRGLVDAVGETAQLGVPSGPASAEVVEQVDAPRLVGISDWVGRAFPAHASAFGKLVLAELPEDRCRGELGRRPLAAPTLRTHTDPEALMEELRRARADGYAEVEDELELGLSAVAVPVRAAGVLVAIVGVAGPTSRFGAPRRQAALPALREAAAALGEEP